MVCKSHRAKGLNESNDLSKKEVDWSFCDESHTAASGKDTTQKLSAIGYVHPIQSSEEKLNQ